MSFDGTYTNDQTHQIHEGILRIMVDETTTTDVTYIGECPHGKGTDENCWLIKIIDETVSGTTDIRYASTDFDKTWDDRASYTYS